MTQIHLIFAAFAMNLVGFIFVAVSTLRIINNKPFKAWRNASLVCFSVAMILLLLSLLLSFLNYDN